MQDPVSPKMRAIIKERLAQIASEEDVTILLAIESGSRAWGFHSPDSDYDVRFIYVRPMTWHYQLGKKRDVIERPIDDELDLSGWELSKALTLMMGSNAVVAEWLQSPIRYSETPKAITALTDFARRSLNRTAVTWHYLSLAERQMERLNNPDGTVKLKRFFYVLRPVLALRWMRLADQGMPPMYMTPLVAGCDLSRQIQDDLADLTKRKMAASEQATTIGAAPSLLALAQSEMTKARDWLGTAQRDRGDAFWQEASQLHLDLSQAFA